MIIPFKGKYSSIKQYMRGKPHPWGFKFCARTEYLALSVTSTSFKSCK